MARRPYHYADERRPRPVILTCTRATRVQTAPGTRIRNTEAHIAMGERERERERERGEGRDY